jgi:hypothetical protein
MISKDFKYDFVSLRNISASFKAAAALSLSMKEKSS